MDTRTLAALLKTLSASPRPLRSFSETETESPDGTRTKKTAIEYAEGLKPVEKEEESKGPTDKKAKIPDWQLAGRRAPHFEAPKQ